MKFRIINVIETRASEKKEYYVIQKKTWYGKWVYFEQFCELLHSLDHSFTYFLSEAEKFNKSDVAVRDDNNKGLQTVVPRIEYLKNLCDKYAKRYGTVKYSISVIEEFSI